MSSKKIVQEKKAASRGGYGFTVFTPQEYATAQVLVSGSNTSILACGDGAVDDNNDLGTVYGYCYQSLSAIPANAPAGAVSVTASGASASWQLNNVPGATCGPPPHKMQTNYLALWVTFPSTPQITKQVQFSGACNGTTTDTCGSGSYGDCGCEASVDHPPIAAELDAAVFNRSGAYDVLPSDLTLEWKPVRGEWQWYDKGASLSLVHADEVEDYRLYIRIGDHDAQGEIVAASADDEPLHLVVKVGNADSACTITISG
jgi:hypothetical protein